MKRPLLKEDLAELVQRPSIVESERRMAMSHSMPRGPLADAVNRGEVKLFQAEFIQQNFPLQRERAAAAAATPKRKKPPGRPNPGPLIRAAYNAWVAEGNTFCNKKDLRQKLRQYIQRHGGPTIGDKTFSRNEF